MSGLLAAVGGSFVGALAGSLVAARAVLRSLRPSPLPSSTETTAQPGNRAR